MKKQYFTLLLMFLLTLINSVNAQCNIKSSDQNSGYVTHYLEPELVAQTDDMGMAFSVQTIGGRYYLASTYQFAGKAVPVEEKIALNLKNGYTIELDMYTMQVGSAAGVEMCMAVFFLEGDNIMYLRKSDLKSVKFRTQNDKEYLLPVTSANDVLVRQLKCFGL